MKRVFFVLIIFAFILTNYGEVEALRKVKVGGEVIGIKEHRPLQVSYFKTSSLQEQYFATITITLRTAEGDITLPVAEGGNLGFYMYDIRIGDIVSAVYIETQDDWEKSMFPRNFFSFVKK